MTDAQIGRSFRAVRLRLRERQVDVAARARVSRHVVSRIERGRLVEVSIRSFRKVADALGISVTSIARWRGGELDRLLNARHAAMHEAALRTFEDYPAWDVHSEASFSVRGERGIIDVLAWHPGRRALLIGELKSEFADPQELVGTMDKRKRLAIAIARERGWDPATVSVWVAVEESRVNRRHLARSRRLLRGAFPEDGHAVRRWLSDPSRPLAALSFMTVAHGASPRQRVSRPRRPATHDRLPRTA
jgi:transcriptional regulator with XRE-family HTH domain